MSTPEFAGRVALVTGAAGGIGSAVADALLDRAATIAAVDKRPVEAREGGSGAKLWPYPADVSDSAQVDGVVDRVEQDLGPIDFLVNVAGVLEPASALSTSDETWRSTFAVNCSGVFHACRAAAARMIERRSGAIVTVASNAGSVPRTRMAAYAASKAASAAFTRCLGLELAPYGIRCNVVAPGSTDTPMFRTLHTGGDPVAAAIDGDRTSFRLGIPLGKIARPDDVAEVVVFLLSDRAGHVTLQNVFVDGGAALGG